MAGKKNAAAAAELTDIEKSALGEICDLISSSLAKAFSEKLGSDVGMTPSDVRSVAFDQIGSILTAPVLLVQLNCAQGLEGQFFLFINGDGLPNVFDLAIPQDAKDVGVDDEVILDEIGIIINKAVSGAMANFAVSMGHSIECSAVDFVVLQDETGLEGIRFLYPEGNLLAASSSLNLEGAEVNVGYLLPLGMSGKLIELLLDDSDSDAGSNDATDVVTGVPVQPAITAQNGIDLAMMSEAPSIREISQPREVQTATFGALPVGNANMMEGTGNISLLLDVMLDASIELGKTQMTIDEILRLSKGSVIELDKLASEPVEFLVNGKIIARGEVVVIDDNFGIRITEILSPRDRLESI